MNKKIPPHKLFTGFVFSLLFGLLFIIPNSFVFAEGNLPIIITTPQDVPVDAPFNIAISGTGFGNTPGEVININTDQKLNANSSLVTTGWQESQITIHHDTYLTPPNILQVGQNSFKIKTSSGTESTPFTIVGIRRGQAAINSVSSFNVHSNDEITINGSGFGTNGVDGKVGIMKDYFELFYPQTNVSWSDNQIRIKLDDLPSNFIGSTNIIVAARLPDTRLYSSNLFPIKIELPICNLWTYSEWGACSVNGQQNRTIINSFPSGCAGGNPVLTQSCTYILACTTNDYSCGGWNTCSVSGSQTRTCTKTSNCDGGVQVPTTSQSCTHMPPICNSWTYSSWSDCQANGTQTRTITNSSPSGCSGGNPTLTQSCTPACTTNDYSCGDWSSCSVSGSQTRACNKISNCGGGTSPQTMQSCTPPCSADTWTCGSWGECSLSGIQNRSCTKTFDCPNVETAPPTTDQYCEAPNRPSQQVPQNSTDEISNQDAIIKSTVKLLCPVDAQRASQGSGTVIDSNGTILTNKHVIAGTLGCLVGFVNDFNNEPYFGERQIADIFKVSSNQDVAMLKIRNPQNRQLTSIDITKGNSNLRLGTKITIYGYPAKFGTNITYTSGDFSGTDGSYLKTTAILEYGNSGGGAYLKDGTFIGIPSAVVKGELNALGYILSINTINSWLGNSSLTYGGTSNNNYSRVSVLEDMDLKKLGSLKLFIPETDAQGNLSAPVPAAPASTTNKNSQNIKKQPQNNQTQKESIIIDSSDSNQKTNPEQDRPAPSEQGKESKKEADSIAKVIEQKRSIVANAVQEIIKVADRNSGVGEQIKTIAQTQNQSQERLETSTQKIQTRSGFAKFFIGPDYGEIKKSRKLLEQNKEQVRQLNQLMPQIVNQDDQKQITEQIQRLEQINQQTETSLNEAQKGFSILGWIFRLFAK